MTLSRLASAWKQARFPWRSKFYVGSDLDGNEYYETSRILGNSGRPKRIVNLKQQIKFSDYTGDEIPVQWQSWLRHTRFDPPTIEELKIANQKREIIIERAKRLDQEWNERKRQLQKQKEAIPQNTTSTTTIAPPLLDYQPPVAPSDTFEPEEWTPASTRDGDRGGSGGNG
ncbi:13569_t:CDS:2 [Ambispora gerdemannii]|uniref:13569_t:CDS:1 n=1 Tax=Ambispora gerdemannii TaxID=144530 RepID=A0A9N9BNQ6_9GLOM|nr:13569_t:CDS:2 [Ambispora gerdemannii]